jgi:hypothetical protein
MNDDRDVYLSPAQGAAGQPRECADEITSEYGVVVHCWKEQSPEFHDCYVAFFGDAFPNGKPAETPYVPGTPRCR